MDKKTRYRGVIRRLIREIVHNIETQTDRTSNGVETLPICDDRRGQYLLVNLGWQAGRRVRATTLHIRLKDDKVWIEEDMTNLGIADELVQAGVPKDDIVLGFQPPERRVLTKFASA
jgi:hypothetical protein